MIRCKKCNAAMKHLDADYYICLAGHHEAKEPTAAIATKCHFGRVTPNAPSSAIIRAELLARWEDLMDMRRLKIPMSIIKTTLNLPFATSTIGRHLRQIMAEKGLPVPKIRGNGPRKKTRSDGKAYGKEAAA